MKKYNNSAEYMNRPRIQLARISRVCKPLCTEIMKLYGVPVRTVRDYTIDVGGVPPVLCHLSYVY